MKVKIINESEKDHYNEIYLKYVYEIEIDFETKTIYYKENTGAKYTRSIANMDRFQNIKNIKITK